ncbi:MAG: SDR family oxidoreductase [Betaproteobacteria bacterium]|nr:MAG: SDR family oxidoreductase [Betaproteobacteria bacterium]
MRSVLITGCDTGLGVEFARQYAAEGYRVFATCLDPNAAEATRAIEGNVRVLKLDVSDLTAIDTLAAELRDEPIDILLSNAGIGRPHPLFGKTDYGHWHRILDVNLIGPMKLAEFVSSRMGSIALNTTGGSYAYRSSKAGLNAVVKGLAIDLQPRHILVLALHPGWAKTEPGGRVDVDRSVAGMRAVIERCSRHETGCFFAFNDTMLPW